MRVRVTPGCKVRVVLVSSSPAGPSGRASPSAATVASAGGAAAVGGATSARPASANRVSGTAVRLVITSSYATAAPPARRSAESPSVRHLTFPVRANRGPGHRVHGRGARLLRRLALVEPERIEGVRRSGAGCAPAATLVHPVRLVGAPRNMPGQRWPGGVVASEAGPLGDGTVDDDRAPVRPDAPRHRRVLRGWAERGHPGHERLGRWRAGLVAEPTGASGPIRRAGQWDAPRAGTRC